MTKTLEDFYNDLGARESGGNYKAVNSFGYIGKYQMGEAAMVDAGYYKPKTFVHYEKIYGMDNLPEKMECIVFRIF